MNINWGVLGAKLGYGVLAGLLGGMAGGQIPTTTGALLSAVTGAAVAAAPSALQASGILHSVSPDQLSLIGTAVQAITLRGQQRQAALQSLAAQAGQQAAVAVLQKTGMFTSEQLGTSLNNGAGGLSITYNSAPATATAVAQPQASDAAVAATGGNQ